MSRFEIPLQETPVCPDFHWSSGNPVVMFWNYVSTVMLLKRWKTFWHYITSQKTANLNDLFSLTGLGYGHQVVVLYSSIYYIIILAWAFFYLFSSFSSELPWANCQNPWNTGIGINLNLQPCYHSSFLTYILYFCIILVLAIRLNTWKSGMYAWCFLQYNADQDSFVYILFCNR